MSARVKCLARKAGHALMVAGQWNAVANGFMVVSDVDTSKVICSVPVNTVPNPEVSK